MAVSTEARRELKEKHRQSRPRKIEVRPYPVQGSPYGSGVSAGKTRPFHAMSRFDGASTEGCAAFLMGTLVAHKSHSLHRKGKKTRDRQHGLH